jgi:hypothetical protein
MDSDSSVSRGDHNSHIYFLDVNVRCGNIWDKPANELGVVHHRRDIWLGVVIKGERKKSSERAHNERRVDFGVVVRVTIA